MAITQYMPDIPDDASMVDWPWTYEEFLPYFERAEHEWGVSGKANQAPAQEPMSPGYEYPMPPLRLHAATEFLMEAFGKAGWQPYRPARDQLAGLRQPPGVLVLRLQPVLRLRAERAATRRTR